MDCPRTIVRDYVVSSTYRKHEQKGANWGTWRSMGFVGDQPSKPVVKPTYGLHSMYQARSNHSRERRAQQVSMLDVLELASPATTACWADLLSGDAGLDPSPGMHKLAAVLALAGLPMRWEPLNSSPQHRGIPSPSSLFPTAVFVMGRRGDMAFAFELFAPQGMLAKRASGNDVEAILGESDLVFVVVGRLGDAVTPYGEFAPCLLSLEGGHLQAQIAMGAMSVGWQCETEASHDFPALRAALGLTDWTELPLAMVRVKGQGAAAALSGEITTRSVAEYLSQADDVLSYPRIEALVDAIAPDPGLGAEIARSRWTTNAPAFQCAGTESLAAIANRRRSGNGDGLAPFQRQLDRATLSGLMEQGMAAFARHPSDLQAIDLNVSLSIQHAEAGLNGGHDVDRRTGLISPWQDNDPRDHMRARVSQAARERSLVITLSIDDNLELSRWGARYFMLAHLAAGSLGQCLCMAAAAHDMSARPIRAYTDFIIDTALPLERRAIYQIICCFERRANPSFVLQ